jgi:hypothetical protein
VLARTAEIPGENVGLGGHGRVYGSVGLRGLSGITVWRWRLGACRISGIWSDYCYMPIRLTPSAIYADAPTGAPNLETACVTSTCDCTLRLSACGTPGVWVRRGWCGV